MTQDEPIQKNRLYYGDNLKVMWDLPIGSVDLIYLDPPFNSGKNYNIFFPGKSQSMTFHDTWVWGEDSEELWTKLNQAGQQVTHDSPMPIIDFLKGMKIATGKNGRNRGAMCAYLLYMAPRLVEMHRILKDTGSIYLHCDPTASHHLKILMDAVFGVENFRNEIVWCYAGGGIPRKDFPRKHDILLRYSRGSEYFFNPPQRHYSETGSGVHSDGSKYDKEHDTTNENDWWVDIPPLNTMAREKLGYPTQKPEALLERIIKASCPPGGVVLDPFCGCGTTVAVAERLGLRWIGIEIEPSGLDVIKDRLRKIKDAKEPEEIGYPTTLDGAKKLFHDDWFLFQKWAIAKVGGYSGGKGVDGGVDGRLPFHGGEVVIQVKGGAVTTDAVEALASRIGKDKIGLLITLREPTESTKATAARQGYYEYKDRVHNSITPHRKYQILTVDEILEAKTKEMIDYPQWAKEEPFKPAPAKAKEPRGRQASLEVA